MNVNELRENFALLDEWEDKYTYIIDLGKQLPVLAEEYKTEANKVKGCTSQVWLVHEKEGDKHNFSINSDALIVQGLAAILMCAFNGKTAAEMEDVPIADIFAELGLASQLSPNRRNGFAAMAQKMLAYAHDCA